MEKDKINILLQSLKSRKQLPKNMDVSKIANRYWFVCHNGESSNLISESSSTGFADDPSTALLKALSEWTERSAYREGHKKQIPICMTDRSDGFAAFPTFDLDAKSKVRESAIYEAIERFVWATWWDNESISFETTNIDRLSESLNLKNHLEEIKKQCNLEEIFIIEPKIESDATKVVILFGKLKSGGYVSGGACGKVSDFKNVLLRSLDELYRHGLAAKKIKSENSTAKSFYEQRLAFFSLGHGNSLIRNRLAKSGSESIKFPDLAFDDMVPHSLEDLFVVHRCLFKNQPPFMGGHLGRFCL